MKLACMWQVKRLEAEIIQQDMVLREASQSSNAARAALQTAQGQLADVRGRGSGAAGSSCHFKSPIG